MRLIDKDNLRKPSKGMFIYQDEFEDDVQHVAFEAYTKDDIEHEPTVEAIPIAWIEMFLEENYPIESPYGTKAYFHDFMKRMIKKWEKENEHNRLG